MKNPLQSLQYYGQSVWLDYVRRSLITSGELKRLIKKDGLRGLTSNLAIFEKAIAESDEYRDRLEAPESQELDAKTLYERIAIRDIQDAADILWPVFLKSKGRDGYVSLEVSPWLAHETQGTLEEARRLWETAAHENLMIKVPGTPEGIPAVQQLITEGINVNITMLFAQATYEQVAAAYLDGLEGLDRRGGDLGKVASVASFCVSRLDTAVDNWIAERLKAALDPGEQAKLRSLLGKVAIASAKSTYQKYLEIYRGDRWQKLSQRGAQTQRLLWASTGTNNSNYSDVLYVEELIGLDTVNAMSSATLDAFRAHGRVRPTLTANVEEAISIMDVVKQVGIPFKELTGQLLDDGVKQFVDTFAKLLKATGRSGKASDDGPVDLMRLELLKDIYEAGHHA